MTSKTKKTINLQKVLFKNLKCEYELPYKYNKN